VRCTKRASSTGLVIGYCHKFNLYLEMGGKCTMCGNSDLQVLVIDHVQYYNHHTGDNGNVWNNRSVWSIIRIDSRLFYEPK
jgi:hypothetical protein